jgi:hypothetical protein
MLLSLKRISIALGIVALTASVPAFAGEPSRNQRTADAVAATLRNSNALTKSRIEIETRDGLVTLTGTVASASEKARAIALTQKVPGVISVADRLRVTGDPRVRPVQYQPGVAQPTQVAGLFHGHGAGGGVSYDGATMGNGMTTPGTITDGTNGGTISGMDGPLPEGPAGMVGGTQASSPGAPNYAWPSYAPYPNFSAVGYPTVYPWQAWPNIGPFYPYPEVPLDWRAVTLRWDDGLWWLDFKKHYTRPFFTPYPFGIFGY